MAKNGNTMWNGRYGAEETKRRDAYQRTASNGTKPSTPTPVGEMRKLGYGSGVYSSKKGADFVHGLIKDLGKKD